jgi:hypothetical protein
MWVSSVGEPSQYPQLRRGLGETSTKGGGVITSQAVGEPSQYPQLRKGLGEALAGGEGGVTARPGSVGELSPTSFAGGLAKPSLEAGGGVTARQRG